MYVELVSERCFEQDHSRIPLPRQLKAVIAAFAPTSDLDIHSPRIGGHLSVQNTREEQNQEKVCGSNLGSATPSGWPANPLEPWTKTPAEMQQRALSSQLS